MGEAAKRIPTEFRIKHDAIPWRLVAAFRNVLIHEYMSIDLEQLWRRVEIDLPPVLTALRQIESDLDTDSKNS